MYTPSLGSGIAVLILGRKYSRLRGSTEKHEGSMEEQPGSKGEQPGSRGEYWGSMHNVRAYCLYRILIG